MKTLDTNSIPPAPRWLPLVLGFALVGCVFLAFSPALLSEFLGWDDADVLLTHTHYHGFSAANLQWMLAATLNGHWMPLTWVSYAIDHALWGMNPRGYHLTNILLHAVNAVLVYVLALRLIMVARGQAAPAPTRVHLAAAFGAMVFAVHPLRAESVAWLTERRDVLSAGFLLGAAIEYLRAVRPGKPGIRSVGAYIASIVLLACSLLSKAWGMSFFVVLLAIDWYPLGRLPFSPWRWLSREARPVLAEKIPFAILGGFALFMAARAVASVASPKTLAEWSIADRLVQAVYGLYFYVRATVAPFGLSPLYELPIPLNPWEPRFLAAYAVFALAAVSLWLLRKRVPALVAAAGVYCVILAPVLGVNQSGEQFVADRYSYLACIGLVVVCAAGVLALFEKLRARPTASPAIVPIVCVAFVLPLIILTLNQTTIWHSTETLWRHAISVTPTPTVRVHYAVELLRLNRPDEAVPQLEAALAERPDDGRAWFMLANEHRRAGKFDQAERAYQNAIMHSPMRYTAQVNLGAMYMKQMNRPQDAVAQFRAAVADIEKGGNRPISALPYLALGDALRRTGDLDGARVAFSKALTFDETRTQAEAELRTLGK